LARFDGYCTADRLAMVKLVSTEAAAVHRVTITLAPGVLDKRDILFAGNRADFDAQPQEYAGNYWYAGDLMLLGDLQPPAFR